MESTNRTKDAAGNRAIAGQIFQLHGVTAWLLLGQIALHVAAAFYHHFIRNDEAMAGMLPRMPCRPRTAELAPGTLPCGNPQP